MNELPWRILHKHQFSGIIEGIGNGNWRYVHSKNRNGDNDLRKSIINTQNIFSRDVNQEEGLVGV